MGGGLSNGGDGLCCRGQVCSGRLGHHIQSMLQGVAKKKNRKTITYNNLYMYVVQSVAESKKITSL